MNLQQALEEGMPRVFGANPTIRLPNREYYFRAAFLRVFCHIHGLKDSVWRAHDRATDAEMDAHLRAQFPCYEDMLQAAVAEVKSREGSARATTPCHGWGTGSG